MTANDCLNAAGRVLIDAGFRPEDARRDASVLARHALGWTMAEWAARSRESVPDGLHERLLALAHRRATREPVAYVTGVREFYGREFQVTKAALIPRPETEGVVEEALKILGIGTTGAAGSTGPAGARNEPTPPSSFLNEDARASETRHHEPVVPVIVDVGTGSGCVAITLALECPSAHVIATDVSAEALELARANARALGADRVVFRELSLLPLDLPRIDLIVSNPPYVPQHHRPSLPSDVRDFEPAIALFSGGDGLDLTRLLVAAARAALTPGGRLVMEIGDGQGDPASDVIRQSGLELELVRNDLQGIARVIVARQPDNDA